MAIDSLQLSENIGIGGKLAVNELADGKLVQYFKLLSADGVSLVEIHEGHGVAANALRVELPTDGTGQVKLAASAGVNIGSVLLLAGTNAIGKLTANSGVIIGAVESAGTVAHDAVGTGINPVLNGAVAYETDNTPPGTSVAELDITRLKADRDGNLLVNTRHPNSWSASSNLSTAATTVLKTAPGASLSFYLTSVTVSSITAQTTKIVSDSAGSPADQVEIIYTGANGNHTATFPNAIRFPANVNIAYITTAAVATSVTVTGYTAP